jgi:hypothetical protein
MDELDVRKIKLSLRLKCWVVQNLNVTCRGSTKSLMREFRGWDPGNLDL